MVAHSWKIEKSLSYKDIQFIIPVYQRNYDWTTEQCKQLLDDIMSIGDNSTGHFIGNIVYISDNIYIPGKIKELTIIDGQQRLTTIMLIYVVLYRLAKKINNHTLADKINETYLINKSALNAERLKLRLTKNNDKAFRFLLDNEPASEYPESSNIIKNFDYIEGRINKENYELVLNGLSKLIFVDIFLERGKDDPQRIFETLNSMGLELSQADLIRNYILMELNPEAQQHIYNEYWDPIEKSARISSSNESRVSDFIRDYLTLENKKIPNKKKVYAEFKAKYPLRSADLRAALYKMKRFVKYYNKLINPDSEPDPDIGEEIKSINLLENIVVYPFLLQIYDDYTSKIIDKSIFIEILKLIQSFILRRFIIGLPTNALNKIFMNLYKEVNEDDYLHSIEHSLMRRKGQQRFPDDKEVIDALRDKELDVNSKNTYYLLEKIENFGKNEKVNIKDNPKIAIEHIFPTEPNTSWRIALPKEEYEDIIKGNYLDIISNLTLSGNKGKLENKSFKEKRDLKDYGYKDSKLWLNKYLASIDKWGINELKHRFDLIKDRFLKIWKYPEILLKASYPEGEVNIFEAKDPTWKKIDYIIFRGKKRYISNALEFYAEIVRQLFELDPDKFFSTDLAKNISLTREEEAKSRNVLKVNDTWVIGASLNNIDKFKKIKYMLSIFQLEDELIIKYAEENPA
jgi:uncharacterized protein with ParB-like and HNH nuclease domain